jgi:putative endonuclease
MFSFKRKVGNQAEKIALNYLCNQGLVLLLQNYNTRLGEIDIIMLDNANDTLVFVEVRYRANNAFGSSVETVTRTKQKKIIRTALLYLQTQDKYQNFICRFDVVGVESDLKYPKIYWIKDAFE